LQKPTERQEVTGLTVNQRPNVNRRFIRQIRAMLHDWDVTDDLNLALEKHLQSRKKYRSSDKKRPLKFRHILLGKIAFVRMVRGKDDPLYERLIEKYRFLSNREYRLKNIAGRTIRVLIRLC